MCGNGLRCVVLELGRCRGTTDGTFTVETDAGVMRCSLTQGVEVSVAMGQARLDAEGARVTPELWPSTPLTPLTLPGTPWKPLPASMGNPHAVLRVEDPKADLGELARLEGPALSTHPAFAEGVNVEWVRVLPGGLEVAVHERGVGPTLACGTGACAALAVAHRLGWVDASEPLPVALPGGTLRIAVASEGASATHTGMVTMIGPAHEVFTGVTSLLGEAHA